MKAQPIAERQLVADADPSCVIDVRLYAPERVLDEVDERKRWKCLVEMEGLPTENKYSRETSWTVAADDSLGALLLALTSVRGALDACYKNLALQFTWAPLKDGEGGHAIPRGITTWLGPDHERHLIDLMLAEDRAFIEAKAQRKARLRNLRQARGEQQ
jgi:hypothetical protein